MSTWRLTQDPDGWHVQQDDEWGWGLWPVTTPDEWPKAFAERAADGPISWTATESGWVGIETTEEKL